MEINRSKAELENHCSRSYFVRQTRHEARCRIVLTSVDGYLFLLISLSVLELPHRCTDHFVVYKRIGVLSSYLQVLSLAIFYLYCRRAFTPFTYFPSSFQGFCLVAPRFPISFLHCKVFPPTSPCSRFASCLILNVCNILMSYSYMCMIPVLIVEVF